MKRSSLLLSRVEIQPEQQPCSLSTPVVSNLAITAISGIYDFDGIILIQVQIYDLLADNFLVAKKVSTKCSECFNFFRRRQRF